MAQLLHSAGGDSANSIPLRDRSPLKFFLLVFTLSVPFWLLGATTELQLLPGLPVSSLMVLSPLLAASILVYREHKFEGLARLLTRAVDFRRVRAKIWFAPIILLMPGIMLLSYGLMRWIGLPLPVAQFPVLGALVMFLLFFIAAVSEELGWSGYALDPMQDRLGALWAGILLGVIWATWHVIPLLQVDRSAAWISWWCLGTVAQRVLMVWLYDNTGKSVFAATLFHDMSNISWQLFPNYGSHYDPRITSLVTFFVAVIVVFIWGPRTLTRHGNA
jgi:membrane protease YdiL (CAAX protease family)